MRMEGEKESNLTLKPLKQDNDDGARADDKKSGQVLTHVILLFKLIPIPHPINNKVI